MKNEKDDQKGVTVKDKPHELVSRRFFLSSALATVGGATGAYSVPWPQPKAWLDKSAKPQAEFAAPPPAGQEASYEWYLPQYTDPSIFTTIGLPADPAETAVSPHGALLYANDLVIQGTRNSRHIPGTQYARNSLAFAFVDGTRIVPIGANHPARQSLENGYFPIVVTSWRHGNLEIRETTFSVSLNGAEFHYQSGLESTLAWAVFELTNRGKEAQPLTLLAAQMGDEKNLKRDLSYSGGAVLEEGSALFSAQVPPGYALEFHPVFPASAGTSVEADPLRFLQRHRGLFNALAVKGQIPPGKNLRIIFNRRFDFPGTLHWGPGPKVIVKPDDLIARSADHDLHAARVTWSDLHEKVSRFETPDDMLNKITRKAMLDGYFLTKRWKGRYIVFDSVCYRCQWDDSSTKWFYALDVMGDHATSERLLDTVFARQGQRKPLGTHTHKGCFSDVTNIERDGSDASWASCNGWALWAMAEHARLTHDSDWIRKHIRQILDGCEWIHRERQLSKEKPDNPCEGLLYGKFICDMPDNGKVSGIGYFTYTDAINYMGLNHIGRLLSDWGHPEGRLVLKEAEDYRQDIVAAIDRLTSKAQNPWYIPFDLSVPTYIDRYDYDVTGPINLAATSEALPCDDVRVQNIIRWIIDRTHRGSLEEATAGTKERASAGAMFYSQDLAITLLELERVEGFLQILYTLLASNISHETLVTCEWRSNTQPHVHSISSLIRMFRTMMIQERGGNLYLLQGIPRRWFEQDKVVKIIEAPTWYGAVSLECSSSVKDGLVKLELKSPERIGEVPIRLKLRLPGGRRIKKVVVNGSDHPHVQGEWVSLTGLTGKADIVVYTS
jgi:hypothetical protein